MTKKLFSIPELVDIGGALEVAASEAVQKDILSIEAQDEWDAILKVLETYHPEWDSIGSFITWAIKQLREG